MGRNSSCVLLLLFVVLVTIGNVAANTNGSNECRAVLYNGGCVGSSCDSACKQKYKVGDNWAFGKCNGAACICSYGC